MPDYFVSPNFLHDKLENPSYADLVDVFEYRVRNWVLVPAASLSTSENGDIASASILMGYFEGIEIYRSGQDSAGRSKEFFRKGFMHVFPPPAGAEHVFNQVVDHLYRQLRCGFAHDGMFRNRVFFSRARPEPILVTWPRKEGKFDQAGSLESAVVNAPQLGERIDRHFSAYVASLRNEQDAELKANFLAAVSLKWGLEDPDPVIATTEAQFFDGA